MDPTVSTTAVEERKENTDDLEEVTENELEEIGSRKNVHKKENYWFLYFHTYIQYFGTETFIRTLKMTILE